MYRKYKRVKRYVSRRGRLCFLVPKVLYLDNTKISDFVPVKANKNIFASYEGLIYLGGVQQGKLHQLRERSEVRDRERGKLCETNETMDKYITKNGSSEHDGTT